MKYCEPMRKWGASINTARVNKLWDCLNHCNMVDLGFRGCKYTWTNKRYHNRLRYHNRFSLIQERLDRCMANTSWINLYPEALVTHLPKIKLDHCPMLLSLIHSSQGSNPKPFRFEPMWCNHHTFKDLVHTCFSQPTNLQQAILVFQSRATACNYRVFGDIFKRMKNINARLDGIQKFKHYHTSTYLQNLKNELL